MLIKWFMAVAVSLAMLATAATAQEVEHAQVPGWVLAAPTDEPGPAVGDAAVRALVIDHQIRFDAEGTHTYTFQRFQVLTRQGLGAVGTVSLEWSPSRERIQVHSLRIVRAGRSSMCSPTRRSRRCAARTAWSPPCSTGG